MSTWKLTACLPPLYVNQHVLHPDQHPAPLAVYVMSLSTTLADLFEQSAKRSPAVWASVGQRANENGDDGAPGRRQRRLRRAFGDSFFPRSLQRDAGFADRRTRSWSSRRDDGGHAMSGLRSRRGPVLP